MKIYLAAVLLTAISCNKVDTLYNPPADNPAKTISRHDINQFVEAQLKQHEYFDWKMAGDTMAWSALVLGDSILSIGYQPAGFSDLDKKIHTIDRTSAAWDDARTEIIRIVKASEGDSKVQIAFKEGVLPVINLHISRLATLKALRASTLVRYAEPIGYGAYMDETTVTDHQAASSILSSGCGYNNGRTDLVSGTDYFPILPGAKSSWNYDANHVTQAWAKTTGKGIKIMLIDTGISDLQENLGSAFNQGESQGRSITKASTFPEEGLGDQCGHGTSMAGVIAGPRGTDGNTAGIAYNSDLLSVHASDNVVLLSSAAIDGVTRAYVMGGDDPAVKIISMSMGTIFSSGEIKDALNYAFNKQKLMFCAAGTSTSFFASFVGVIFPANQPQVIAVTGVKDNLTERCDDCHFGSKVEFTIVMEKSSTGRNPLSIAMSGDIPSTVGGSSVATASCAAIAALVWSRYPGYPKDSIVARMARSGNYARARSSKFGWGVVNADVAAGS